MPRTKEITGVDAYFDALQSILKLQSQILTGVLPHNAERGRNDEERFRDFLTKVLPKRFSIGTGFIICSDPTVPISSQTDVVIFDEIHNSPLHKELSAFVYPVEMIYGTVEVKGVLRSQDLEKIAIDIEKIRNLAPYRVYLEYGATQKLRGRPDQLVVDPKEFTIKSPTTRTFVFAYSQKGWQTIDAVVESLQITLKERSNTHIHGLVILDKGWYLAQEAYSSTGYEFFTYTDNALLRFTTGLLHTISSMPMYQASIDRYLKPKIGSNVGTQVE
jgi:hypothetical protein